MVVLYFVRIGGLSSTLGGVHLLKVIPIPVWEFFLICFIFTIVARGEQQSAIVGIKSDLELGEGQVREIIVLWVIVQLYSYGRAYLSSEVEDYFTRFIGRRYETT